MVQNAFAFYTHLLKRVLVPWNGAEGVKQLGLIHHHRQRVKIADRCGGKNYRSSYILNIFSGKFQLWQGCADPLFT